jgi:MFS family permease
VSERENGSLGLSLYLLVLLTALHTLSLTDRFLIAAFGTQISLDLGLSNQQFGLVTGLAFTLFYASTGPVAGLLVDRFGPGRLLGTGVLIWSAMTGLTGMAKSFLGLWLPRTLVGVGEAILIPAASRICRRGHLLPLPARHHNETCRTRWRV